VAAADAAMRAAADIVGMFDPGMVARPLCGRVSARTGVLVSVLEYCL